MPARTDVEAIQKEWEAYQVAVAAIAAGDIKTYREVSERIGYPLVKSLPGLMVLLKRAESERDNYERHLDRVMKKLADTQKEVKQLQSQMELERKAENETALKKGAKKKDDGQS